MANYIIESGVTSNGIYMSDYDYMEIKSGGRANNTTIQVYYFNNSSGGLQTVYGVASSTTLYGGIQEVYSGGVASSTYLTRYFMIDPLMEYGYYCSPGEQHIYDGGVAQYTSITDGGYQTVYAGGVANGTDIQGGYLYGEYSYQAVGGTANNTYVHSNGWQTVGSGGVANSTTVYSGGRLSVNDGGTASNVSQGKGGALQVYVTGNEQTKITGVNPNGSFSLSNGVASNFYLDDLGAFLSVAGGGIANNTTICNGGRIYIGGGIVNNLVHGAGGVIIIYDVTAENQAQVTGTNSSGSFYLSSGVAYNFILNSFIGQIGVSSGGVASRTTINDSSIQYIKNGGLAKDTKINSLGAENISSGGITSNTQIYGGGIQRVYDGGITYGTIVNSSGEQSISSGGVSYETVINQGVQNIFSGGIASNAIINSFGKQCVLDNGVVYNTSLTGGQQHVSSGGVANNTIISASGQQYIYNGGTASGAIISSMGTQVVFSGGTAHDVNVLSGGSYCLNGGRSYEALINSGGLLIVSSGVSYLGGTFRIAGVMNMIGELNAQNNMLIFMVDQHQTTDAYMISDIALISNAAYTITVNSNQEFGTYSLAAGASGFSRTITVQDTSGSNYGVVSVGGALNYNNVSYALSVDSSGVLQLSVASLVASDTVKLYSSGILISSAVTMYDTSLNSGMSQYVSFGGIANNTIVNSGGEQQVLSGGVANGMTISRGGWQGTWNGGMVSSMVIEGTQETFLGGIASSIIINGGGRQRISGGTASEIIISSGGYLYISSGGTALGIEQKNGGNVLVNVYDSETVVSGTNALGKFSLQNGIASNFILYNDSQSVNGTANNTVISGGWQFIWGMANDTIISRGGHQTVSSGSANNTIIYDGGSQIVELWGNTLSSIIRGGTLIIYGGQAKNTVISNAGEQRVSDGGMVNDTIICSGGREEIYRNGTANDSIISGGTQYVSSGGVANSTTIIGGEQVVFSGGVANNTVIDEAPGGYSQSLQTILSGGIASNTVVLNGRQYVEFGGAAYGTVVSSGAWQYVSSGGAALGVDQKAGGIVRVDIIGGDKETIVSGTNELGNFSLTSGVASNFIFYSGRHYISSGGVAHNTVLSSGALEIVQSGGVTLGVVQKVGGNIQVEVIGGDNETIVSGTNESGSFSLKNGVASNFILYQDGGLNISSGGIAENTTVYDCRLYVSSGGVANNTILRDGGRQYIEAGGVANGTIVSYGILDVSSGGIANDTVIFDGVHYIDGGVANNTVVHNGQLRIVSGGIVNSSIVNDGSIATKSGTWINDTVVFGGWLGIGDGSVASNTIIGSGGSMYLAGGIHQGRLEIADGAVVSAYNEFVIDFSVDGHNAGDSALVSNFNLIEGHDDGSYSITIAADQVAGIYKLASNASSFNYCTTVKDTDSNILGVLCVGNSLSNGNYSYSLTLDSGILSLQVKNALIDVRSNLLNNGYSQIVAWDSAGGKVGYVATNGQSAPPWAGIWEWGGNEAAMWKVVAVGKFSADVEHDGILLYNGNGNTFAAWTDLGRGDYGYVSLCHVDGNFQTLGLADFDNNGLDDVIIYDENGSFGIVSDAAAYHDVWHVDNPETNVQKVIGAGYFGNDDGKSDILVKNTATGVYYLWHNEDPTFESWNWSQTEVGKLTDDWEVAAIGDFQGDGVDDIIIWQKSTGYMLAWENGKSSEVRWVGALDPNTWEVAAVGDYNGDGKEDLLLREQASGWGGLGYWGAGSANNWTDLNARIETDMESKFAVIA